MKNFFFFLVCIFFIGLSETYCQPEPKMPQFFTPNVASFTKFVDNNVNINNGSVDVSIPVYTIKDGNIEIPITPPAGADM
jgi:hypothetical protein